MSSFVLGIDIGGTNTQYGLVDESGEVHHSGSLKTRDYSSVEQLAEGIHEKIGEHRIESIGIGAPNGNIHNGTIEHAPNLEWKGIVPLAAVFETKFNVPTRVTNDANVAALGEMQFGAAVNMKNFVVVTLGTGVGSGFVCNGELVYGHSGMAGELGHVIVEPHGRLCGCGRNGCLETYASATGFLRTVDELRTAKKCWSPLINVRRNRLTAELVSRHAKEGDPMAIEAFEITAQFLARGLATAIAITSPEAVILCGGLAQSGDTLLSPTNKHLNEQVLPVFLNTFQLLTSGIKSGNAAVVGAAAVAREIS